MEKDILDRISKSLNDTKIDLIAADSGALEKALAITGRNLFSLSEEEISQHIYTITQHLIFVQLQCNGRRIKYIEAKRAYEMELARLITKSTAKTVKERTSECLIEHDHLRNLEKQMRICEADVTLFDKIPEHISELANALKKALSTKTGSISYRGR